MCQGVLLLQCAQCFPPLMLARPHPSAALTVLRAAGGRGIMTQRGDGNGGAVGVPAAVFVDPAAHADAVAGYSQTPLVVGWAAPPQLPRAHVLPSAVSSPSAFFAQASLATGLLHMPRQVCNRRRGRRRVQV